MSEGLSYRDAGVDIDAGDALVEAIKPFAQKTIRPEVLAGIGGFGALCEIPKKYKQPVLVSGTDGVGTKLKLAFAQHRHTTVGIDLVAMSVNLGPGTYEGGVLEFRDRASEVVRDRVPNTGAGDGAPVAGRPPLCQPPFAGWPGIGDRTPGPRPD